MDLNRREAGQLERVANRVGVMRPRAGVEHEAVGEPLDAVQALDELAFVVGAEERRHEPELVRDGADPQLQLIDRERPVLSWVTATELVEVDPMHHLNPVADSHWIANSATGAISARVSPQRRDAIRRDVAVGDDDHELLDHRLGYQHPIERSRCSSGSSPASLAWS